jgi:DNA-binding CsgD family transcriptional regulator
MEIVEIVLFLIAYTLGIATLIVQIVCYLKKMEYMVTIIFVTSFLFLIIAVSVNELNFILTNQTNNLVNESVTFFMLVLALTTPLNVHTERIVKFAPLVNKFIYMLTAALFLFQLSGYIAGFKEMARTVIEIFMFCSIGYSMIIMLNSKPIMHVKHWGRIDKVTSIIFFTFFPVFFVFDLFYDQLVFIHRFIPQGQYLLMLFFIYLSSMKLIDDMKRLTLFSRKNSINPHVLAKHGVTSRETEVLTLIVRGKSYNEISAQLFISLPTVKTHITRAYKKMNVKNKIELINLLNFPQNQPDTVLNQ